MFTWNEKAHVLPGPENVVVGVDAVNVPESVYEIVAARAATEQRTNTSNNRFSVEFMEIDYKPELPVLEQSPRKLKLVVLG